MARAAHTMSRIRQRNQIPKISQPGNLRSKLIGLSCASICPAYGGVEGHKRDEAYDVSRSTGKRKTCSELTSLVQSVLVNFASFMTTRIRFASMASMRMVR